MNGTETRALILDTSGPSGILGLAQANALVRETELSPSRGYGSVLADAVSALLGDAGWEPRSLESIVVGLGPGSFAGSRIGVAFAKGLAFATQAKLYGVSTPSAIARGVREDFAVEQAVVVLIDAGRGHTYLFLNGEDAFLPDDDARQLIARTGGRPLLVGSAASRFGDVGDVRGGYETVRARDLLLASQALDDVTPDEIVPRYVQPPRITYPRSSE